MKKNKEKNGIGIFAAFLTVLCVLCALFTAYYFIGGMLKVSVRTETVAAGEYESAYQVMRESVQDGSAVAVYRQEIPESADACKLVRVTLSLHNYGMFPAEWLEITVTPASGDIALYEVQGLETDTPAFGNGEAELRFLSYDNGPRTVKLSYYVLGLRRTVTVRVED